MDRPCSYCGAEDHSLIGCYSYLREQILIRKAIKNVDIRYLCPRCGGEVGKGRTGRFRYTCPHCLVSYYDPIVSSTPDPPKLVDIEPIRAWKLAKIHYDRDGRFIGFKGVVNGSYKPVDEAECVGGGLRYRLVHDRNDSHDFETIPVVDCSCGFYALKIPPIDASELKYGSSQHVMLEVELYGKLIKASEGYRAQKQRVIAVYGIWELNQDPRMNRCGVTNYTIAEKQRLVDPCTNPIVALVDGIPYCKAHIVHRKGERTKVERVKPNVGNLEFHWLN